MKREGISFTLTIVVAGVILLMTALSIITLGGSSISQFFNTVNDERSDQVQELDVQEACQEKARQIERNYCSNYVNTAGNTPDCGNFQSTRTTDYTRTATSAGCDWTANAGISTTVQVQGSTFDCIDEGYLGSTCPAR